MVWLSLSVGGCGCVWIKDFGKPMVVVVGLMSVGVGVVGYGCDSTIVETIDNLLQVLLKIPHCIFVLFKEFSFDLI